MASRCIAFLLALGALTPGAATAATLLPMGTGAFQVPVTSMAERQWERVIAQQYDFSCGSAAVATLLTYHYGLPRPEEAVFRAMYAVGDQEKIRAEGFSMLDLKRYLDSLGLSADGFRMSLDQLAEVGVPGIVLVNTNGYQHFVVIKGVRGDHVLVGDPAGGTVPLPRATMEKIWNGIVLAARGRFEVAREHFNHADDWAVRPEAPVAMARRQQHPGIPIFGMQLPGLREIGR